MKIASKRLILRPFTLNDVDNVDRYSKKESVTTFMVWGPNTFEQTENFVKHVVYQSRLKPQLEHHFMVQLKEGPVIGACSITFDKLSEPPALGWVFDDQYWNQGYGTETAKALLSYAFNTLKVRQVYATCQEENIGSARVMEKNAMRYVKTISKEYPKLGKVMVRVYEITALEYRLNNHKTFI